MGYIENPEKLYEKMRTNVDIVAAAGSDQAGAAELIGDVNMVTGADGSKGVKLPEVEANKVVDIHSIATDGTGSNVALKIYPASDEKINGGSANAAVTLTPASNEQAMVRAVKKANGDWYVVEVKGTVS